MKLSTDSQSSSIELDIIPSTELIILKSFSEAQVGEKFAIIKNVINHNVGEGYYLSDGKGGLLTITVSKSSDTEISLTKSSYDRVVNNTSKTPNKFNYYPEIETYSAPTIDTQLIPKKFVDDSLATKQNTLVSGTNIKTINNTSILGSGNIEIGGADFEVITSQEINNLFNPATDLYFDLADGNWSGSYPEYYTGNEGDIIDPFLENCYNALQSSSTFNCTINDGENEVVGVCTPIDDVSASWTSEDETITATLEYKEVEVQGESYYYLVLTYTGEEE